MNRNFMKICNQTKSEIVRRWISVLMMISLLAGSVSIASFAKGADKTKKGWEFGAEISNGKTSKGTRKAGAATSSNLLREAATPSNANVPINTLGELLEQTDDSGAIIADWFRIKLDETVISDSSNYSLTLKPGTEIPPDAIVEHRLQIRLLPEMGDIEEEDVVTWNLGRIEGLNLPEVVGEELIKNGDHYGYAYLRYEEDGTLYLTMEFYEAIQEHLIITYWYESTFVPVEERTVLEFDLPGYEEPGWAVLLPEQEETSPGETEPDETTPEETTSEETSPEVTTQEETTPAETTVAETTGDSGKKKSSSGGGSSSVSSTTATTAAVTTVAEGSTTTAAERESMVQPQELIRETLPDTGNRPKKNETDGQDKGNSSSTAESEKAATEEMERQKTKQPQDNFLKLDIIEAAGGHDQVQPGELIVYRIVVRNEGTEIIKDIRVRDYLPNYTSFVEVEDGSYGVINGRQHVTWMIDQLQPGGGKELELIVRVFPCIPENHRIENQIYWQADNEAQTNDPENPSMVRSLPAIIVG